MGKPVKKKKKSAPLPVKPMPSDKLEKVKAPKPKARVKEKPQQLDMGSQSGVMVTYTCEYELCDLPNREFQRPRRGGRVPKFCSDQHRNAAHHAKNGGQARSTSGSRTPSKTGTERALFEFLFANVVMEVTANNTRVIVPSQTLELPDRLAPALLTALRRQHEEA